MANGFLVPFATGALTELQRQKQLSDEIAASVAKKKKLRDAPAAKAISDADTIAKLKAAWDTSVLGDSPYA